ncbi:MAG: FAD-dependent oxidoreductase [Candidatus Peregrinibacteria bacterium]
MQWLRKSTIILIAVSGLIGGAGLVFVFLTSPGNPTLSTDILIYGSSLGGTSAAITAAENGSSIILATDSSMIGGQAVEAGMSAFDDSNTDWQNFGLYGDLQAFLQKKYGTVSGSHFGLGSSKNGTVSTLPSDIEEFFLARIHSNPLITLLTENELVAVHKNWLGKFVSATLREKKSGMTKTIAFRYMVDGTETGKVLKKAGVETAVGFDTQEDTKEPSALPRQVRDCLVDGCTIDGKVITGLSNRVQAVSAPFAMLDKGYPGTFYPVSKALADCWLPSAKKSFIRGAETFEANRAGCTATILIAPDFDDIYDVFFINQGKNSFQTSLSTELWGSSPINTDILTSATENFVKMGTFAFTRSSPTRITLTSLTPSSAIEGVILVAKNIHEPPVIISNPQEKTLSYARSGLKYVQATITITTRAPLTTDTVRFSVDGSQVEAKMTGLSTYSAESIPLDLNGSMIFQNILPSLLSSVLLTPSAAASPSALSFEGDSPETMIPVEEAKAASIFSSVSRPVKEWTFTSTESGTHLFAMDGLENLWFGFELFDVTNNAPIKTTMQILHNVSRNPLPLFVAPLQSDTIYRVRMGLTAQDPWIPFRWTTTPLQKSNLLWRGRSEPRTLSAPDFAGIYDLWLRAPKESTVSLTSERGTLKEDLAAFSMPTSANEQNFQYAGKVYLDALTKLTASAPAVEMLAIPNLSVPTWTFPVRSDEAKADMRIKELPPGLFRAVVSGGEFAALSALTLTPDGADSAESLPLSVAWNSAVTSHSFAQKGGTLTVRLPTTKLTASGTITFYEDIPPLTSSWSFSMNAHPLMGTGTSLHVPLFQFRNIVSGEHLLESSVLRLLPRLPVANDSQGIALIVNPSNDLAPVMPDDLDTDALQKRAEDLSLSYAYWMQNDYRGDARGLGCDPSAFTCTTARAQKVIGLFSDPLSLFPPALYIREGRRLPSVSPMTENDLRIPLLACTDPACAKDACSPVPGRADVCSSHATPVFPEDGLLPVQYLMDIHTFFDPLEYFLDWKPFLKSMTDLSLLDGTTLLSTDRILTSRPSQIRLGALLPKNGNTLYAASLNIGATQIANSALRIHSNELAIGQSVGALLSYCLQQQSDPQHLSPSAVQAFRAFLIHKEFPIFPITGTASDPLLAKGVQYLLLHRDLSPSMQIPYRSAKSIVSRYSVAPDKSLDAHDLLMVKKYFGYSASQGEKITFRQVVLWLTGSVAQREQDESAAQRTTRVNLLKRLSTLPPSFAILDREITKGDLYRAISVKIGQSGS